MLLPRLPLPGWGAHAMTWLAMPCPPVGQNAAAPEAARTGPANQGPCALQQGTGVRVALLNARGFRFQAGGLMP